MLPKCTFESGLDCAKVQLGFRFGLHQNVLWEGSLCQAGVSSQVPSLPWLHRTARADTWDPTKYTTNWQSTNWQKLWHHFSRLTTIFYFSESVRLAKCCGQFLQLWFCSVRSPAYLEMEFWPLGNESSPFCRTDWFHAQWHSTCKDSILSFECLAYWSRWLEVTL